MVRYDERMLLDFAPFEMISRSRDTRARALEAVISLLRRKFDLVIGYDARRFPLANASLADAHALGEMLRSHGVIKSFAPSILLPDMPRFFSWAAICNLPNEHQVAGASFERSERALMAALAEALERYLWLSETDYFVAPLRATEREIARMRSYTPISRYAGFTDAERAQSPERALRADAPYLWVRGTSLISKRPTYVPAQLVSGRNDIRHHESAHEPIIRQQNSNGLASWPTKTGAQLAGMLELIEREAYMIMWLNQLTLPRFSHETLAAFDARLAVLLDTMKRYRLRMHVVRLLTDAPTHAICVILEDRAGHGPRYSFGLKAHRSLTYAIEKAATEALRAHRGYRLHTAEHPAWDDTTPIEQIGHRDRLYYWGAHPEHLEFTVQGEEIAAPRAAWEDDSEAAHHERLLEWCRAEKLECVSVPLTHSKKNPSDLHIEMTLMPDLQPMHLKERECATGAPRWRTIPERLGYQSRAEPFTERPHPFS